MILADWLDAGRVRLIVPSWPLIAVRREEQAHGVVLHLPRARIHILRHVRVPTIMIWRGRSQLTLSLNHVGPVEQDGAVCQMIRPASGSFHVERCQEPPAYLDEFRVIWGACLGSHGWSELHVAPHFVRWTIFLRPSWNGCGALGAEWDWRLSHYLTAQPETGTDIHVGRITRIGAPVGCTMSIDGDGQRGWLRKVCPAPVVRHDGVLVLDPDFTFDANTESDTIRGRDAVYNTARDTANYTMASLVSGQDFNGALYDVYRLALRFDTSAVPMWVGLDSATVRLDVLNDSSLVDFDLQLVRSDWISPLSSNQQSNFEKLRDAPVLASVSTSGLGAEAVFSVDPAEVPYGAVDSAWFPGIRSSRDASSTAPSGDEWVQFQPETASDPQQRPLLELDGHIEQRWRRSRAGDIFGPNVLRPVIPGD